MSNDPPKMLTTRELPSYTFVPGESPHPISDPQGHSYGAHEDAPSPICPEDWQISETYLWGIDLFQHGYFWEAHEAWESLWHAHQRTGIIADFLKGLIQLAVAGVKVLQRKPESIKKHGKRAGELLQSVRDQLQNDSTFCGLNLEELLALSQRLAEGEQTTLQLTLPQ